MRKVGILFIGLSVLSSFGCPARSIFPLFADKDMVFVPGLVSTWVDTGKTLMEENTLSIKKAGERNYYLMEFSVGKDGDQVETNTYYAYLGRLGDFWFLDSCQQIRQDENYDLIPTHLFFRLWLEGDTLRLAALDGDWLDEMIGKKNISISHLLLEDEIVLTAATPELQQLVRRFAEDREAFPDPATYVRLK